jgi:hypothetical protein
MRRSRGTRHAVTASTLRRPTAEKSGLSGAVCSARCNSTAKAALSPAEATALWLARMRSTRVDVRGPWLGRTQDRGDITAQQQEERRALRPPALQEETTILKCEPIHTKKV